MYLLPSAQSDHDERGLVLDQTTAQFSIDDSALTTHLVDSTNFTLAGLAYPLSIAPDFGSFPAHLSLLDPFYELRGAGGLSTIPEGQEEEVNVDFDSTAALFNLGSQGLIDDFVIQPRLAPPVDSHWTWETCFESTREADSTDTLSTVSLRSSQPPCSSVPLFEQTPGFDSSEPSLLLNYNNMTGALSNGSQCPIELSKPRSVSQQNSVFSCCGRSYKRSKELQRHKRLAHLEQPDEWRCPKADCLRFTKGFTRKDRWWRHVRAHGGVYNDASLLEQVAQDCHSRARPIGESDQELVPHRSSSLNKLQSTFKDVVENQAVAAESGSENAILGKSTAIGSSSTVSIICEGAGSLQGRLPGDGSAAEQQRPYNCKIDGCTSGFSYRSDCVRHEKSMHDVGEGYRCAGMGCKKAEKVWTRLDNFKKHLDKWHGDQDREQLVQNSRFSRSAESRFPSAWTFTIETPDQLNQ